MKITEGRYIEPCCEWAKGWIRYFRVRDKSIIMVDFYGEPLYGDSPVMFCPVCGAKTEISEDVK